MGHLTAAVRGFVFLPNCLMVIDAVTRRAESCTGERKVGGAWCAEERKVGGSPLYRGT